MMCSCTCTYIDFACTGTGTYWAGHYDTPPGSSSQQHHSALSTQIVESHVIINVIDSNSPIEAVRAAERTPQLIAPDQLGFCLATHQLVDRMSIRSQYRNRRLNASKSRVRRKARTHSSGKRGSIFQNKCVERITP